MRVITALKRQPVAVGRMDACNPRKIAQPEFRRWGGRGGGSGVVITNNDASIVNVPHTTDPHSASLENELVICCFQPQCATM